MQNEHPEHTYTVDGLINGGGAIISRIIYLLTNGWAYIREELKTGGGPLSGIYCVFLDRIS